MKKLLKVVGIAIGIYLCGFVALMAISPTFRAKVEADNTAAASKARSAEADRAYEAAARARAAAEKLQALMNRAEKIKAEGREATKEELGSLTRDYSAILAANSDPISLQQYGDLYSGMSYLKATSTLLHLGTEMSRVEMGEYETVVYKWQNLDGSNVLVTFQNDRLRAKAQFGLK